VFRNPVSGSEFLRRGSSASVREKTHEKSHFDICFSPSICLHRSGIAGDVTKAKTEADCKAAGGMWDAATNTCTEKKM
jgi:hypothetical protein